MSEHGQRARDILEVVAWVGMLSLALIVISALMPGLHELADRWRRVARTAKRNQHRGSHRLEVVDGRVGGGNSPVADPTNGGAANPKGEEAGT